MTKIFLALAKRLNNMSIFFNRELTCNRTPQQAKDQKPVHM